MTRAEEMVERVARVMRDARALPGTKPVARLSDVDRRAAHAAIAIVVEAAAEVAETHPFTDSRFAAPYGIACRSIATAIRALHPAPQQGASDA